MLCSLWISKMNFQLFSWSVNFSFMNNKFDSLRIWSVFRIAAKKCNWVLKKVLRKDNYKWKVLSDKPFKWIFNFLIIWALFLLKENSVYFDL